MIEGKNVKNGNVKCMRKKVFSEDEERKKEIRCQKVQNNNKFKEMKKTVIFNEVNMK